MTPDQAVCVILARHPALGMGKTRLARDTGPLQALHISRKLLHHTFQTGCDARWTTVLAVTPDHALKTPLTGDFVSRSPRTLIIPQGKGDLGMRLERLMMQFLPQRLVIIGSDCPFMTKSDIHTAFQYLGRDQCVFGPAEDGGFWLAGFGPHALWDKGRARSIVWSSSHTLAQTRRACHHLQKGPDLPTYRDIDRVEDYRFYKGHDLCHE
jgi:rSAM/selenodomain-associated transferase 1